MRIAQIVLAGASEYERKSQRVDAEALAPAHEVEVMTALPPGKPRADVAHVYGPRDLPRSLFTRFPIPYVANGAPRRRRLALRPPAEPGYVVSPVAGTGAHHLPEGVEARYFEPGPARASKLPRVVGTFGGSRAGVRATVEQTLVRIRRFRDDVEWLLFDRPPSPEDLARVDAWIDPASDERDYDGFVAEAIAAGVVAVATRTPVNVHRLEKGRTGFLVPPGDSNELAHAILAALFKIEIVQPKQDAARQTSSKFRSRHRLRVLSQMYENLVTGDR